MICFPNVIPDRFLTFLSQIRGPRIQIVSRPKNFYQVIFYIPEHPRTLLKRFGTFLRPQETFKSHFQDFWSKLIFCVFSLYGSTKGLHRNYTGIWVQTDSNTFFGQILIPTSPKSSLQYQKTFLLTRTTLGKSKNMIGVIRN